MSEAEPVPRSRWRSVWADALAFIAGLALAWYGEWQTRDLVWSLWLSSLLVGYAMIVWRIFGPAVMIGTGMWRDRQLLAGESPVPIVLGGVAYLVGGLFLLAFFTVHFGMFHFVHSVFLNLFFPAVAGGMKNGPSAGLYLHVLQTYWPFVLVAAVAERNAFRLDPEASVATVTQGTTPGKGKGGFDGMMAAYKNVVRLHVLIFFFAFASFMKVDSFAVYVVVYAVYFFPWRVLRTGK
ncbi:MAG TPA: DUF6498-containing protein [Opitutaceae bacterium]|nr:DUF6498-containing protein [Opitutaceae bacterium]HND60015.1 DUF6498-containing protein [Opitutaceae bacterium]